MKNTPLEYRIQYTDWIESYLGGKPDQIILDQVALVV